MKQLFSSSILLCRSSEDSEATDGKKKKLEHFRKYLVEKNEASLDKKKKKLSKNRMMETTVKIEADRCQL